MKNKNTIESLKKEKLITTANKIIPNMINRIEVIQQNQFEAWNEYVKDANVYGMWLIDFLKRKKKRFEDFSIEIEELYSEKAVKRNLKAKTTPETHVSDNPELGKVIKNRNNANWRSDLIKSKCGF